MPILTNLRLRAMEFYQRWRVWQAKGRLHDKELVAITEHIIETINPRLRVISGYRRKLGPSAQQIRNYTEHLIAEIPGPITVSPQTWGQDPLVRILFSSTDDLRWIFSRSSALRDFFHQQPQQDFCYALFNAILAKRTVLGTEADGQVLTREVQQTQINFTDRRVVLPATDLDQLRVNLRWRTLEVFVAYVLEQLTRLEEQIESLTQQQRMLQMKSRLVNVQAHGLDQLLFSSEARLQEMAATEQRLAEVTQELAEAQAPIATLDAYLERIKEAFTQPKLHLQLHPLQLWVDRMNIQRAENDPNAQVFQFQEAQLGNQKRIPLLVKFARTDLLPEQEILKRVQQAVA